MIRFDNVTKSFGKREILKGVTLEIEKGKTTVIFGVSGGGKSTIIKHMVGLLKPDSGTITYKGIRIDNADETYITRNPKTNRFFVSKRSTCLTV